MYDSLQATSHKVCDMHVPSGPRAENGECNVCHAQLNCRVRSPPIDHHCPRVGRSAYERNRTDSTGVVACNESLGKSSVRRVMVVTLFRFEKLGLAS